jgi:hypothetical protein
MKKTELGLIGLIALGILFKILHYPGWAIILIVSVGILSQMYFALGFAIFNCIGLRDLFKSDSYRSTTVSSIAIGVITGLGLSLTLMGLLFKTMSYPGAYFMLYPGMATIGLILIIVLIQKQSMGRSKFTTLITRIVPFFILGAILLCTPRRTRLSWQYPNNPEYIEALVNASEHPENSELQLKVDEEYFKMREQFKKEHSEKE